VKRVALTILMAAIIGGLGVDSAVAEPWRSIRSRAAGPLYQLAITTGSVSDARKDLRWERLDLGDTLVFDCAGATELQIQMRAIVSTPSDRIAFRYGMAIGGASRRFLRHARFDGFFYLSDAATGVILPDRVLLGDLDRMSVETRSATEARIYLGGDEPQAALIRFVVRGGEPEHRDVAMRGEVSFDFALGGAGYESNAYLAPKTGVAPEGKTFWPADVTAEYRNRHGLPFDLRARYEFVGRFFEDPILDERRHAVETRERWDFGRRGRARDVELTLTQDLLTKNDTFFGRGDFEEFQTAGSTNLSDRFDYAEGRLGSALLTEWSRSVSTHIDAAWARRNYDEDYVEQSDIYSLDQNRWEGGARLVWKPRPAFELSVRAALERVDYDEKFSRDRAGTEIVTEPAQYRSWPLEIELRRRASVGIQARLSFGWTKTEDLFGAYWDNSERRYRAGLGWKHASGHSLSADLRGSYKNYDIARVNYNTANPLRKKDRTAIELNAFYSVRPGLGLLLNWSSEDRGNNTDLFAYDRSELFGGLVYRY